MPLRDPNIYVRGSQDFLDARLLCYFEDLSFSGVVTRRDLVSKDKMIWCGEVQQKGQPKLGAPPPPRPSHPS
ncbi:hypothetical protein Tco_0381660 [Tanacetum coccineum]